MKQSILFSKSDTMMNSNSNNLTKEKLQKHLLKNGVHPLVVNHLEGAGFFGSLINGISKTANFIIKNKDTIAKGVKIGTEAYKTGKTLYDQIKGAKLSAGNLPSAGALKKNGGKLNPAMRKRVEFMGEMMRGKKMTMKQASDAYKKKQLGM